jgi:YegS/Rv2252/BmrU family lipid kinase
VSRICLILNPAAGQKAGLATNRFGLDDARLLLAQHDLAAEIRCTERAAHATQLAHEAVAEGFDVILAAGGDGTVAEVAEALIGSGAVLGVLPLGSVMNVARMLGVPRDLEGAIRVVKASRIAAIDVGWARASARQRFFLEAAGVGIDAGLFAYVNQIDHGNLRSIRALIAFLRRFRSRRVRLRLDEETLDVSAMMVTVANGPYLGAALPLAPDAKLDDAQFDVKVYTRFSKFELARHFLSITRGHRPYNPKIISRCARTVEIGAPRPLMAHADSHPLGTTPARFELRPAALRVFIGDQADCPPALRLRSAAAAR